jgi:carboxyl-terminal processing protease
MPQRNFLILLMAAALSYACYVRGEQNPFARYVSDALEAIEQDSLQELPNEELFVGAMDGMIGALRKHGDEHSQFVSREDADPFRTELRQQFGGIGVRIRIAGEPPQLTIAGPPEPGTPAARTNLLSGDQILAIDDRSTDGLSMADVLRLMRGVPGTPIRLTILHAGESEPQTIELVRETIMIDSILGDVRRADGTWEFQLADDPRIAAIRITTFANKTAAELGQVLARLQAQGVDAAVLDLRDNAGGALDAAVALCDMFLPAGESIVETRGRNQELRDRYVASGNGRYQDLPLAVIVNGNTASASEIMAACLQDHGRAVIVGERSFGKGTVQELLPVESGRSLLKLTTASYWRPSGENIHRMPDATPEDSWGVEPNTEYEVPLTDQEYAAYRQYRSQRDLLEQPPATDGAEATAPEPDFSDRPLRAAVEYLQGELDERSGL